MANDAIAKYGKDTTIAQFSKLIKPQLDKLQEKYGREQFDKGFTELTGIKSDIEDLSNIRRVSFFRQFSQSRCKSS